MKFKHEGKSFTYRSIYCVGVCLICYAWPWRHFYSIVDLTKSVKIEHLLIRLEIKWSEIFQISAINWPRALLRDIHLTRFT